jgi:hypothetical protein
LQVLEYVQSAISVSGLSPQQQIECMIEGGLIFQRVGLTRKHGFHLYAAALHCIESENFSLGQALVPFASYPPLPCLDLT